MHGGRAVLCAGVLGGRRMRRLRWRLRVIDQSGFTFGKRETVRAWVLRGVLVRKAAIEENDS